MAASLVRRNMRPRARVAAGDVTSRQLEGADLTYLRDSRLLPSVISRAPEAPREPVGVGRVFPQGGIRPDHPRPKDTAGRSLSPTAALPCPKVISPRARPAARAYPSRSWLTAEPWVEILPNSPPPPPPGRRPISSIMISAVSLHWGAIQDYCYRARQATSQAQIWYAQRLCGYGTQCACTDSQHSGSASPPSDRLQRSSMLTGRGGVVSPRVRAPRPSGRVMVRIPRARRRACCRACISGSPTSGALAMRTVVGSADDSSRLTCKLTTA
ncbi:MAG: hypothetical protein FRX49_07378 [Trebouxia sp. A1-2]|nr:MAG: hypothetical protein FRX49_07378 [Trebouxia sp. A1-2]